jgi:adenylate kinase family enzyme
MRIEFIGLPGTGKTTLTKFIISKNNRFTHRQWMSMDDVILEWYASQKRTLKK